MTCQLSTLMYLSANTMMQSLLSVAAVLTLINCIPGTLASDGCSLSNFTMNGLKGCVLQWWTNVRLKGAVSNRYNISQIVEQLILNRTDGIPRANLNTLIKATTGYASSNQLNDLIEAALVLEPYLVYSVADYFVGRKNNDDRIHITLPPNLSTDDDWMRVVAEYMDASCGRFGTKPLMSCLKRWIKQNCGSRVENLLGVLRSLQEAYCERERSKPELMNTFEKDFGSVAENIFEIIDLAKVANSLLPFNIFGDMRNENENVAIKQLQDISSNQCGFSFNVIVDGVITLKDSDAELGLPRILRAFSAHIRCIVKESQVQLSEFADLKMLVEHLNVVAQRYGATVVESGKEGSVADKQFSVGFYGSTAVISHNSLPPKICPIIGWNTYLHNEFFTLRGYGEALTNGETAATISKVKIDFYGDDRVYQYEPFQEDISTRAVGDNYHINSLGGLSVGGLMFTQTKDEEVQIIQLSSLTVFGVRKHRGRYMVVVRLAENILEHSLGFLTLGCSYSLELSKLTNITDECRDQCVGISKHYRGTCEMDCILADNLEAAREAELIQELFESVEEEDKKIIEPHGVEMVESHADAMTVSYTLSYLLLLTNSVLY